VGTFGERLRREREMRGINLDEISTATKISTRNLRALEEEKFNQLPGGVFNRGFVRAYAKFLGIDEEQIIAEYDAAAQETETAREQKLVADLAKAEVKRPSDEEISLEPKSQWGSIAVIVLVAVIAYAAYNFYQRKKTEREHPSPPAPSAMTPSKTAPSRDNEATTPVAPESNVPADGLPSATSAGTPSPVTTASNKSVSEPSKEQVSATATPAAINVKLTVLQESWISVRADGKLVVSGTLAAGMEKTYRGNEKIEVVLGKAGGVELSYNGKAVENLSQGQDVRKITFTPSGYE
jgi:cytoskeleton protein RodZ